MDIRALLQSANIPTDQIEATLANPLLVSVLESAYKSFEDGKTALLKAQEIEQNLKTWNQNEVVPYVRKADDRVAKAEGEIAQLKAYMKSLKDAGYEIPDAMLSSATPTPTSTPAASTGIDSKTFEDRTLDIARTNMELISLSNK